jgi:hypothetical protein
MYQKNHHKKIIDEENLKILNNKNMTFTSFAKGSQSAVDLTVVTPDLYIEFRT